VIFTRSAWSSETRLVPHRSVLAVLPHLPVDRHDGGDVLMTATHPMLDGTPILIGDRLLAIDTDATGFDGRVFQMEGRVISISSDYYGTTLVLLPDGDDDKVLSEEFLTDRPEHILSRIESPKEQP
jgi:hypothetical protein